MRVPVIVMFGLSYFAVLVYLASLGLFLNRLKTVSAADYERFGSPSLLALKPEQQRAMFKNFPKLFRYLASKGYQQVGDNPLNRWGSSVRVSFVVAMCSIISQFYWLVQA